MSADTSRAGQCAGERVLSQQPFVNGLWDDDFPALRPSVKIHTGEWLPSGGGQVTEVPCRLVFECWVKILQL